MEIDHATEPGFAIRLDPWMRPSLFAIAFIAYALCSGYGAYWLDSGELAGSGATLGVAHPPGHPLYAVLAHMASLVPIGSMGFRISLLSAAAAAWAVVLVYDVSRLACGKDSQSWAGLFFPALVSLAFAFSGGLFLQAIRAEVYTLNLLFILLALKLALSWKQETPAYDGGKALKVAFLVGLGLANHHLLVAAFVPALFLWLLHVPEGRALARQRGFAIFAFTTMGLLVYCYLPLRAATDPIFNYGDPRTFGRLFDVILAKGFQASVAAPDIDVVANIVAAASMLEEALGWMILGLAPVGLFLMFRGDKWLALTFLVLVLGNLATKLMMELDPLNPDAAGYFLATMATLVILAAFALVRLHASSIRWLKGTSFVLGALVAVLAVDVSSKHIQAHDLADSRSAAVVDAWIVRDMPPGSVVMPLYYATYFNRNYHASVDGYRPDLVNIHESFERRVDGGRPFAEIVKRREPSLGTMMDASVAKGRFPQAEAQALAASRPIFIEPFIHLEGDVDLDTLGDTGFYMNLWPEGKRRAPPMTARSTFSTLLAHVGDELVHTSDARRMMAVLGLYTAIVRLKQGSGIEATKALNFVEALLPGSDLHSVRLRWGPLSKSVGELAHALAVLKGSKDERAWEQNLLFAKHADYRALFGAADN